MSLGHLSDSEIKEALALKERLDLIKKQKGCQDKFLNFVEHMWDGFICGRHHKIFAEKLEGIANALGCMFGADCSTLSKANEEEWKELDGEK